MYASALTILASSASVQRSFSKMKNFKNYARNTQGNTYKPFLVSIGEGMYVYMYI